MRIQPVITPVGHLIIEQAEATEFAGTDLDPAFAEILSAAFTESSAAGLIKLITSNPGSSLPPEFAFWREFADRFIQQLHQLNEEELQKSVSRRTGDASPDVPFLDESELSHRIDSAPPMRGLEYLTPVVLDRIWNELAAYVFQQAADREDGAVAYLHSLNPLRNFLGRVTFHLAEHKRDPERPFAFLATYAHRVSKSAKLQHLPLAEALKQYAGEKNQEKLAALLEPVQTAARESSLVRELIETRQLFQPQAWTISQAHRFLTNVPQMEAAGLVVRVPDWWTARQTSRPEVSVRIGQQSSGQVGMDSLLDFSIDLALDGEPLSENERKELLASTDGLALLRGKWVEVDNEKLNQALEHWHAVEQLHAHGIDFIQGMRMLAGVPAEADARDEVIADWSHVSAGDWLGETLQKLRDPSGIIDCEPGRDLEATLRPYQQDGVRWLWFMTHLGLGACLADDMGLGKTIQVIDLLLILKREQSEQNGNRKKPHKSSPSLLIVPASLVGNWKNEFERFAPALNVLYAHRSECDSETLAALKRYPQKSLAAYDAVVTTYGMARRFEWLEKMNWRLIVLDEAQAIKNASSAQSKSIRKLNAAGRIALSGTPVENHLGELWSLFSFCCPGLLGNASRFKTFVKELQKQEDSQAYGAIRRLVKPYILRRLKTDPGIVPDLPDKTEMRTECSLTKKQVVLYEQTLKDLERRLESSEGIERRGLVLSTLMQLKQICNHPSQFLKNNDFPSKQSGKFQRLQQVCEPIVGRQERMLVFTQFQSLTEPLAEYLETLFGRPGLVLHGGVPVKKRKQLVSEFQAEDGPPFFVISVKAGGTGLNLTAASHVIHFDRWWNPAVENQATDRAFRIGQKRNVLVHKFVCRGTVEERIDQMIRDKQELADEILSDGAEQSLTEMNDRELLEFVSIDLSRASGDDR